jgi:hypothetical protein
MREVTKAMLSYTWAMSVFSIQQAANLFSRGAEPRGNRAAEVFDEVTGAVTGELDGRLKTVFRAGDNLQRQLVDAVSAGIGVLNPGRSMRSDATAGTANGGGRGGGHCGCSGNAASGGGMPPGWIFGRAPAGAGGAQDGHRPSGSADGPSAERPCEGPMPAC